MREQKLVRTRLDRVATKRLHLCPRLKDESQAEIRCILGRSGRDRIAYWRHKVPRIIVRFIALSFEIDISEVRDYNNPYCITFS